MTVGLITNFPSFVGLGKYAVEIHNYLSKQIDIKLVYCKDDANVLKEGAIEVRGTNFPAMKKTLNACYVYPKRVPTFDLYHIGNQFLARIAEHRKPTVASVFDFYFLHSRKNSPFASRAIMRRAFASLKKADRIIVPATSIKSELVKDFGVQEDCVEIVRLAVDIARYTPVDKMEARKKLELPLDKKIIYNVGAETDPRKNAETVFKSFHQALSKDKDLFLVKLGKQDEKITRFVDEKGIASSVLRKAKIAEEEMPLYYAAADLYVNLDLSTGMGLPPLEAMACGTPVMTSEGVDFKEFYGDSAVPVYPSSADEVASKIAEVLGDDGLMKRLVKKGLENAQNSSWEMAAQRTLGVYKKVVPSIV